MRHNWLHLARSGRTATPGWGVERYSIKAFEGVGIGVVPNGAIITKRGTGFPDQCAGLSVESAGSARTARTASAALSLAQQANCAPRSKFTRVAP